MTSSALVQAAAILRDEVERMRFAAPVAYVYDPLVYAWAAHAQYLERYGASTKDVVLVGMNPGPWGMAQTGVPFGEVAMVTQWLGIDAPIARPKKEHPKRPVLGLACPRSEVSGARLWGAIAQKHPDPRTFFEGTNGGPRCFVLNFCPLLFLEESGRNITPDKLPTRERAPLEAACRRHLAAALDALAPRRCVLGVGAYAAKHVAAVAAGRGVAWGALPHPSPASPAANRGWAESARAALQKLRVEGLM